MSRLAPVCATVLAGTRLWPAADPLRAGSRMGSASQEELRREPPGSTRGREH
jgi:hypothetical protein